MAVAFQGAGSPLGKVSDYLACLHKFHATTCVAEVDLLPRWRLFLPAQWSEASSPDINGGMDPNLVLAHLAHNAAVLQLHQSVAYPPAELRATTVSFPLEGSARTCTHAAGEISSISEEFVRRSAGLVHPLVSFCLFLAGRVLLGKHTLSFNFG